MKNAIKATDPNPNDSVPVKNIQTVQAEFKESLGRKPESRNDYSETFLRIAARVLDTPHLNTFALTDALSISKTFDIPSDEVTTLFQRWIKHLIASGHVKEQVPSLYDYPVYIRRYI